MNKVLITLAVLGVVGLSFLLIVGLTVSSSLNQDAKTKNLLEAQTKTRDAFFDKVYKIIQQKTQVTVAENNMQKELAKTLIEGRQASFVKIITESNPESAFDRKQFISLSNTIEAQREGFFREQKKILDIVKENHDLHDMAISSVVLSMFGREKAECPTIITSEAAQQVLSSGQENDIDLGL